MSQLSRWIKSQRSVKEEKKRYPTARESPSEILCYLIFRPCDSCCDLQVKPTIQSTVVNITGRVGSLSEASSGSYPNRCAKVSYEFAVMD